MADLLYDLLTPQLGGGVPGAGGDDDSGSGGPSPAGVPAADADALAYLGALAAKPLGSLQAEEPRALAQTAHSLQLALQALAKKAYQPVLESARRHAALQTALPRLAASTAELQKAIPALDDAVGHFSTTFRGSGSGSGSGGGAGAGADASAAAAGQAVLARRRQALLLSRNAERLVDVLELPPLLTSAVAAAAQPGHYATALDLNGHIRRLHTLYPDSPLVRSVAAEADEAMRATATSLVLSLKAPNLKLAAALRTIGWLRRVLPDLESSGSGLDIATATVLQPTTTTTTTTASSTTLPRPSGAAAQESALGALFLVCRLATLTTTLDALAPLRELADQERARQATLGAGSAWTGGQQTERYLKRYLEIFREQSFAIVSMYRSIFPSAGAGAGATGTVGETGDGATDDVAADPLEPLPPALATFPLHLVDLLLATLHQYLPTVRDQAARDGLLTQVLYCAGSLGRLGGDFGLFLATLDVGGGSAAAEKEWVEVVRRHRQLAGRLESMVGEPREKR